MENTTIIQTAKAIEELFETVMKVYWAELNALEYYMHRIPSTETKLLEEMTTLVEDVKTSLEHDIGVFSKAINDDSEGLQSFHDKLKVNDIYEKLNKK